METVEKTLVIKQRGRKYFACEVGHHKASLVINAASCGLESEHIVRVVVYDLSTHTRHGTRLVYDPVEVISDQSAAPSDLAHDRRDAEHWLAIAESDVLRRVTDSEAVHQTMSSCAHYKHLAERLTALQRSIAIINGGRSSHRQPVTPTSSQGSKAQSSAKQRLLLPRTHQPPINKPIRWRGRTLVFTWIGKPFRIHDGHPALEGSHLIGHEGEFGCYCYYRQASPGETAVNGIKGAVTH